MNETNQSRAPKEANPRTLIDILQYRASHQPNKRAYTFLADGEIEQGTVTFAELDRKARLVAATLQAYAKPGDRALLLYPPGIEYIASFFGCLYAGVIAVPAYPPRGNSNADRVLSIVQDAGATMGLGSSDVIRQLHGKRSDIGQFTALRWIDAEASCESNVSGGGVCRTQDLRSDGIAFLQYTSGSTTAPKGVMVTHGNLMHNEEILAKAFGHSEDSVIVSWLPIYHDMGLIGAVLASAYCGAHYIFMSPAAFLQQPLRWFRAISKYKATFSGVPNFAFDLCTRRIGQGLAGIDLSSVRALANGAEPVRAESIAEFVRMFSCYGLEPKTIRPAYGLAECTLVVSAGSAKGPVLRSFETAALEQSCVREVVDSGKDSRFLVGCGDTSHHRIVIVNPETLHSCRPGQVGEIWVSSASVAAGYWNNPEATKTTFHAYVADTGEGPFTRTGDLGFVHEEQLFIAGRIKDLIILNGRNLYPQDIELIVERSHSALRQAGGAAFAIEVEGVERLVVVHEVERSRIRGLDFDEVISSVRQTVAIELEAEVYAIALLKPGSIPKTSSGKIQRSLCRKKYLAGELELLNKESDQPAAPLVHEIASPRGAMDFSLFYFSSNEAEFQQQKYRLLLEGARFADEHRFASVWVPERHFHAFGGIYPNPSVLASALAVSTKHIRVRAGSVVLPLHNPIRVAEEWAVVDNLSGGRVDMAFARGWNPNDFVLSPENYTNSLKVLYRDLEVVRKLWRGDSIVVPNGKGAETPVRIYPLPQQPELPVWITCSGGIERFVEAGEGGWNILTALLFQSPEELGRKIVAYREARARRGHNPDAGHVTLMLHTFLGDSEARVKEQVRGPFIEYLKTSIDLWQHNSKDLNSLTEEERGRALDFAFERYYHTSGLFGTPESCFAMVNDLGRAGVNEIACLIDFGVETEVVLQGLRSLDELKSKFLGTPNRQTLHDIASATRCEGKGNQAAHLFTSTVQPTHERNHALQSERLLEHTGLAAPEQNIAANMALANWVEQEIVGGIARITRTEQGLIGCSKNFFSLGINSLKAIEIIDDIQDRLGLKLSPTLLFEFPTIEQLAAALAQRYGKELTVRMSSGAASKQDAVPNKGLAADEGSLNGSATVRNEKKTNGAIAIIGMACRFPGAPDAESFWKLLVGGHDAVTEVPADHWDWRAHYDSNPETENKTYSRWGGFLENIDLFDAAFFNISPREARVIDPQQRIILEMAWQAFEHSGYPPESLAELPVGVFIGASYNGYYRQIHSRLKHSDHAAAIGNHNAIIANRLSFFLNLHGPSLLVDTLCSSSLVAVHLACQSLRTGECSVALAGGINILLSPENFVAMSRMKGFSPDGRCKSFDHRANGICFGEGSGALVLKPLHQALEDGDTVHGVIRGSAINHGGQTNGLTAPNPQAQANLIRRALTSAGVSAESISYVEAHGTGTALGDPIEVEGLTKAFRSFTSKTQFCAIGSVKSNLGHLESAAGMAGIAKVVLAMQHKQLPATLHFEKPNPLISFAATPFKVQSELTDWPSETVRRAGVSSFGIGGSNAHVVLEEAPALPAAENKPEPSSGLFVLSAKTATGLTALAARYQSFLQSTPRVSLSDLYFTVTSGRTHFTHRLASVARDADSLKEDLAAFVARRTPAGMCVGSLKESEKTRIAFLFTGQGSSYSGMGRQLYDTNPTFRTAMDRCDKLLHDSLKESLTARLFSNQSGDQLTSNAVFAQTALFALEYALTEMWKEWGIVPDIVMGHSLGEYAASVAVGTLSFEDGLHLVAERARLIERHALPSGAMAMIFASQDVASQFAAAYAGQVSLAAVNSPKHTVVSGQKEAVQQILDACAAEGIASQPLKVTHAFHSPLLDPVLAPFEKTARQFQFHSPGIPVVSNLTGTVMPPGEIQDSVYWRRQMREPVQFAAGVRSLAEYGCKVFVEIGPGSSLLGLAKRSLERQVPVAWLPSLAGSDEWESLLHSLGALYVRGVPVNWNGFNAHGTGRRIPLPTYPFERERFWLDEGRPESSSDHGAELAYLSRQEKQSVGGNAGGRTADVITNDERGQVWARVTEPTEQLPQAGDAVGQAIHCLKWQRIMSPTAAAFEGRCVVVAQDNDELAERLVSRLRQAGSPCTRVVPEELEGTLPAERVVCLWGRGSDEANEADRAMKTQLMASAGLAMVQLLVKQGWTGRLWWVTRGAVAVTVQEAADVGQAALWGLGRAVMQEHPELDCTLIDIEEKTGVEDQLVCELNSGDGEQEIAWRAGERRAARLMHASASTAPRPELRTQGTVLITGGLGALGLHVARSLAGRGVKHLVLAARRGKETPGAAEAVVELESLGAQVTVAAVDVSQREGLGTLLETIPSHLPLRGVVHAAGIGDDGMLLDQSPERFARVLLPKVGGALNLDALTRGADLDFFILISSVASTIVPAGRAGYAAANACLDALAARRCAEGLPGQSLAWGLWVDGSSKGVGLASGMDSVQQARLRKRGLKAVDPSRGMALFEAALGRSEAQLLLVELDLRAAAKTFEGAVPSLWRELVGAPQRADSAAQEGGWAHEIGSMTEASRLEMVIELVRTEVARVLSSGARAVDVDRPLKELGFDSLMAVELRTRLSKRAGVMLPATLAFDYPTTAAIAKYIVTKLGFAVDAQPNTPKEPALTSADEMSLTEALGLIRIEYERVIADA